MTIAEDTRPPDQAFCLAAGARGKFFGPPSYASMRIVPFMPAV